MANRTADALLWLFNADPAEYPHAGVLYEYITLLESDMDTASIAEWRQQANDNSIEDD